LFSGFKGKSYNNRDFIRLTGKTLKLSIRGRAGNNYAIIQFSKNNKFRGDLPLLVISLPLVVILSLLANVYRPL